MAAQKEKEVAQKAEQHHPDHVELKEEVKGVETSSHRAQMLHKSGKT